MVSVRALTSRRSSASKSRTGSAGVRSTGSPNRRIGLTLTNTLLDNRWRATLLPWRRRPSFYPAPDPGRVELNPDGRAVLARAAGRLRRVQRAGEHPAISPADPDQGSFLRFSRVGEVPPRGGG